MFPYLRRESGREGEFNIRNAEQLADSLTLATGMNAVAETGHGNDRHENTWSLEEDPSIHPDDSEDMPVEIVSPPLSLSETVEMMPRFFTWAEKN
jgi:hypothetical protein